MGICEEVISKLGKLVSLKRSLEKEHRNFRKYKNDERLEHQGNVGSEERQRSGDLPHQKLLRI